MSSELFDDKSAHVIPFILSHLERYPKNNPFFIGLNGVQGAGKTVLTNTLHQTLISSPYKLNTVVFALDDLYLTHGNQVALANNNSGNPLLQHRGQPGTHDISLLLDIFAALQDGKPTKIPKYDKSRFSGKGDRAPENEWTSVNTDSTDPVRVVLFEGWCVGFQPLPFPQLEAAHSAAVGVLKNDSSRYHGRLGHNSLESVAAINQYLEQYTKVWSYFNVFVHIDAADPLYVYKWRLQQEATTKRQKGAGMTDEEVKEFVDGYYPSYELYTETLRRGIFPPRGEGGGEDADVVKDRKGDGKQLRLVVGEDRKVKEVIKI